MTVSLPPLLSRLPFAPLFADAAFDPRVDGSMWERHGAGWVCEEEGAAPSPFHEIAPSIQAAVPRGAALRIQMTAGDGGREAALLDVGFLGDERLAPSRRRLQDPRGKVDVDLLRLGGPGRSWRVRLTATGSEPWTWRWGVCGVTWRGRGRHPRWRTPPALKRRIELAVPRASQMAEGGRDGRVACSPTTVQMLLGHRGVRLPVPRVMRAAYDPVNRIYGNWQRAIVAAWEFGRPAAFVYLRHWDHVLACLRAGVPVGASIKFPRGKVDLPGAPIEHSAGHLIVVRGLTPSGDVLVNDPAAPSRRSVSRTYPLAPLSRAWFGFSGVGYLVF